MGLDQANEIYTILGTDIIDAITIEEARDDLFGEMMRTNERAYNNTWSVLNYRKGGSND